MKIQTVHDDTFRPYGKILTGYDFSLLLETLRKSTPRPADAVVYVPSEPQLESSSVMPVLRDNVYGGMPIQIGYCNGSNTKLNCLEYHRDSEINITVDDAVLLVAPQHKIDDGKLDTSLVEAFLLPAGTAVELYATTLHYAPCQADSANGFQVAIVLPKDTNTDKPEITPLSQEDKLLWAKNKWLLALPETAEAAQGAYIGLTGKNIDIKE